MSRCIAITTRAADALSYDEQREALSHEWIKFIEQREFLPLAVPRCSTLALTYLTEFRPSALILSNGESLQTPLSDRDINEQALLMYAIEMGIPVLAVCRGLQLVNTALGGRTCAGDDTVATSHAGKAHRVSLHGRWKKQHLADCYVNSFHHDAVFADQLSPELELLALGPNDVVEAATHRSVPLLAVQWHPERINPSSASRLVQYVAHFVSRR